MGQDLLDTVAGAEGEPRAIVPLHLPGDRRMAKRSGGDRLLDRPILLGQAGHSRPPRGPGIEQIIGDHHGARGKGDRFQGLHRAIGGIDRSPACARFRILGTAAQLQAGQLGQATQRFAAKPEGGDLIEVGAIANFAGAVGLGGAFEVGAIKAAAIIRDPDPPAIEPEGDLNPSGPGIDRIVNQLAHGSGGRVDGFPGGDAIDRRVG